MKTGTYLRISTEEGKKKNNSIPAQRNALTRYADENGFIIEKEYIDEGISAKEIDTRPGLISLLKDVEDGKIDAILIKEEDRLIRNLLLQLKMYGLLLDCDCKLFTLAGEIDLQNDDDVFISQVKGSIAELEAKKVGKRIRFILQDKVKSGFYINTQGIFGYDYIVGEFTIIPNEIESKIVKWIFESFIEGKSYTGLAKELNQRNIYGKKGGKWTSNSIKYILTNVTYIGKTPYGKNKKAKKRRKSFVADGKHEAIIKKAIFEKTQNEINIRSKNNITKPSGDDVLFQGVLRCKKCGAKLNITRPMIRKKTYIRYKCKNVETKKCDAPSMSQTKLENFAFKRFKPSTCDDWPTMHQKAKKQYIKQHIDMILVNGGKDYDLQVYYHNV